MVNDITHGTSPTRTCTLLRRGLPALRQRTAYCGALARPRSATGSLAARFRPSAILFALSLVLAGCAVGPRFQRPPYPKGATYLPKSTSHPMSTSGAADSSEQKLELGTDLPGQWWELFHSPELRKLVKRALVKNQDLKAAQAALNQAQENLYAAQSSLFPTLGGALQAQRAQINAASLGFPAINPTFSVVTGTLSATYFPDIWGGLRRQIEALGAGVDYQRFQLEATYLTLTSQLVNTAISIASIRGQLSETNRIIATEAAQLAIMRRQLAIGGISKTEILLQQTTLAETRATLPPLLKQLSLLQNQLTALVGQFPNDGLQPHFTLDNLSLPKRLPISLPSKLIEQRPDIRAAEALLHAASAKVGIATANQFPQFTISVSTGGTADGFTNLFSAATGIWSIMGGVSQTLFDAGALQDKKRAAADALLEASAQYRATVIKAFQNVSDALQSTQIDAATFKARVRAEKSADQSYALAKEKYHWGAIDYLSLLQADRALLHAKLSLIQARAARLSDTVVLFQSLGGGWWNRRDASQAPQGSALFSPTFATTLRQ